VRIRHAESDGVEQVGVILHVLSASTITEFPPVNKTVDVHAQLIFELMAAKVKEFVAGFGYVIFVTPSSVREHVAAQRDGVVTVVDQALPGRTYRIIPLVDQGIGT